MQETITIFFNGTGHDDKVEVKDDIQIYSLANLLYHQLIHKKNSLLFPGVGIIHPIRGTLFGTGIEAQIQTAKEFILARIKTDNHLTLNLFGHSRGAISALILTQKLANIDPGLLSINLVLHDPVPGNFIASGKIDTMKFTLAKQTMNLKHCKNLKKVLSLYTNRSYNSYNPREFAHAPLFPRYPDYTNLHEQIIPGIHSDAQNSYYYKDKLYFSHPGSLIAYHACTKFLNENRTILHMPSKFYYFNEKQRKVTEILQTKIHLGLIQAYQHACAETQEHSVKIGHGHARIVIATYPQGVYFNTQHRMLEGNSNQRVQVRFEHRPNSLEEIYPYMFASLLGISSSSLLFSITQMGLPHSVIVGTCLMLIYLAPQWLDTKIEPQIIRQPR